MKKDSKGTKNFKSKKVRIRPFSGGMKKINKDSKSLKNTKSKQRPKTAKNSNKIFDTQPKSPGSLKLLSPKSSKRTFSRKSTVPNFDKSEKKTKSSKRKSSLSPTSPANKNNTVESMNTFARATNQNDIMEYMVKKPEDGSSQESDERIIKAEDIKINNLVNEKGKQRQKVEEGKQSKSVIGFETPINKEDKESRNEIISKSLRLLKKKRPTSAKNLDKNAQETNNEQEKEEKFMQIMDKLKNFKSQRSAKKVRPEPDVNKNADKPPIDSTRNKLDRNPSIQKSLESMSDRIGQMSPSLAGEIGFSTQKYQEILKKQIQEDYLRESKYVESRRKQREDKCKMLVKHKKMSSDSFEREKIAIEKWADKNMNMIKEKKKKYLMLFGNLNELATIMKDKKPKPRKIRKNHSLSDSEIKLSEDINHSDLSQRHERRNSSHLKTEGRNHLLDADLFQAFPIDSTKSLDKLR